MPEQNEAGISPEGPDLLTQGLGAEDNPTGGTGVDQGETTTPDTKTERPAWMDQLTDDLKENESLTKFKNFSDLGKSYVELEGKLGNMVSVPGEDASDEDRAAYREKMGIPEAADKYELAVADGVPDYLKDSLGRSEESLKKRLFDAGVSQEAAKSIYGWMQEELKIGDEALQAFQKKQLAKADGALKDEWKGDYDKNLTVMTNGLRRFATPDFINYVKQSGLGNNPEFCKVFYEIGKRVSEDTAIDPGDEQLDDFEPGEYVLKL